MTIHRLLPFAAVAALAVFVGCSSSSSDSGTPAKDTGAGTDTAPGLNILVGGTGNVFSPATLTIKVGQTVTWTWAGSGHSVTSGKSCTGDSKFDSGVLATGATFSQKFDTAGTVDYFCSVHCGAGMTGQIIVTP